MLPPKPEAIASCPSGDQSAPPAKLELCWRGSHPALGYDSLTCADDDDAIGKAKPLADSSAIELWSGERFITRLEYKSK